MAWAAQLPFSEDASLKLAECIILVQTSGVLGKPQAQRIVLAEVVPSQLTDSVRQHKTKGLLAHEGI
jgi:hypothetical protein